MPASRAGISRRVLWTLCWPVARVLATWFPYSTVRRCPVPVGPYVAVINHLSHLDPPMVGLALRHPVRFLALDELWGYAPVLDLIFKVFGAVPLPREGRYPVRALKVALGHLELGETVAVFPEGRRVRCWGDTPLGRGAAWLSIRAGVPVVPVAVWGTQHAMPPDTMRIRRAPIWVVVGCAIEPGGFADRQDPVGALTEAVHSVLDHEIRRMSSDGVPRDGPAPT